jgi:Ser/Thr protein kinase RdoA (MazF antagonist)
MEINEELRLLTLLKENNISVSYPIPDKSGNYLQMVYAPEGPRYAVLFSYAQGMKIRNISEEICSSIGTLIGKIHKATIDQKFQRVDYDVQTLTKLPYQLAASYFSEKLPEMEFIKSAGKHLATLFEGAADSGNLRSGAVHLDLWYDNMNITDDSAITIFDFDFCGNGWLLLDIAYFNLQLFNTEPDLELFEKKSAAFFKSYENITPISAEERALLPNAGLAIWIFYLGVQVQRFDNWSNIFLSENYLKHFIGVIRKWLKFNQIEINGENEVYV